MTPMSAIATTGVINTLINILAKLPVRSPSSRPPSCATEAPRREYEPSFRDKGASKTSPESSSADATLRCAPEVYSGCDG